MTKIKMTVLFVPRTGKKKRAIIIQDRWVKMILAKKFQFVLINTKTLLKFNLVQTKNLNCYEVESYNNPQVASFIV